jgi:hypothetical protein
MHTQGEGAKVGMRCATAAAGCVAEGTANHSSR